jgi:hypothetical protein
VVLAHRRLLAAPVLVDQVEEETVPPRLLLDVMQRIMAVEAALPTDYTPAALGIQELLS